MSVSSQVDSHYPHTQKSTNGASMKLFNRVQPERTARASPILGSNGFSLTSKLPEPLSGTSCNCISSLELLASPSLRPVPSDRLFAQSLPTSRQLERPRLTVAFVRLLTYAMSPTVSSAGSPHSALIFPPEPPASYCVLQ